MNILKLVLQLIPLLCSIKAAAAAAAAAPSLAKPNCQDVCGSVSIPYPFGIGKGCYHDRSYEISCNRSVIPNKPFLKRFNLEVLNVSLRNEYSSIMHTVTVNAPVASNCKGDRLWNSTNFGESPFNVSDWNSFTVLGCENALLMSQQNGDILAGCTSICKNTNMKGCYGIDCCQAYIPYGLDMYSVNIAHDLTANTAKNCTYAFLLDPASLAYNSSSVTSLTSRVKQTEHAPALLEWEMTNLTIDPEDRNSGYYCYTLDNEMTGAIANYTYTCYCSDTYEGNPYIPHGCKVIEECAQCKGYCYRAQEDTDKFVCDRKRPSLKGIIIGVSTSGGSSLLLLGSFVV